MRVPENRWNETLKKHLSSVKYSKIKFDYKFEDYKYNNVTGEEELKKYLENLS